LASYRFYPATATIETPQGNIEIELFRKDAPVGVAKFISLASKGAFQGLRFTQPVPFSFIGLEVPKIRTELDGTAACEINMHAFEKGSVGMTAGTNRIFITLAPAPDLDGMEPCIGRVISGMSVAEKIGSGDRIKKVQIKEYIGFLHVIRY
jgi:peptidyl-prolyl cis-trans isomerase B (cyclophilin B)